jgi:DnaK suppressor protein
MNEKDLDRVRERLQEERETRVSALAEFDDRARERLSLGDDDLSKYPLHPADDGTDTMEQEKEFLLASQEGRQLMAIDTALRMLYQNPDQFGYCENCGRSIRMERLDLVPWTRYCVDCQEQAEALGEGAGAKEEESA